MLLVDLFYYTAGGFLILMSASKSQRKMRLLHIGGSFLFVTYGVLAGAIPVAVMNSIIMFFNIYHLMAGTPPGR